MNFSRDRFSNLAAVICILVLTFAVYIQLSTHEFLILDDNAYVINNQHVQSGLKVKNIYWAFTTLDAEFWHPLTWLSYMLDTELYGVIPGGFLLTNLILHLLNSLLVFYLFKLITQKTWESFFVSALFALHPLHVEAVSWIAERKELLCGFFWLTATISYYFYVKSPDWKKYSLIVIFFVAGIMSKTMIVTLPFTFLLLDFWPLERVSCLKNKILGLKQWQPLIIEKIPLFLITIAGIAVTLFAQGRGGGLVSLEKFSLSQRLANCLFAYAGYIKKTVLPENLSVFYPVKDIEPIVLIIYLLLLVVVSLFCLYYSKKQKYLLTGWLWFLGTLVPVIGIVKIGNFSMADRFTYIPLIGLFVMFSFGITAIVSKLSRSGKQIWHGLIFFVIFGYFIPNTFQQIKTWKNSETLFKHSIKAVENNYLAHHSLGEFYAGKGNFKKAVFHFAKAAQIKPKEPLLWIKLGRILYTVAAPYSDPDSDSASVFSSDSNSSLNAGSSSVSNSSVHSRTSSSFTREDLILKAVSSFKMAQQMAINHSVPHFYLLCAYLDQGENCKAKEQLLFMLEKNSEPDIFEKYVGLDIKLRLSNCNHGFSKFVIADENGHSPTMLGLNNSENKECKITDKDLRKILRKTGIINSKDSFRSLIIKGHQYWEEKYLKAELK